VKLPRPNPPKPTLIELLIPNTIAPLQPLPPLDLLHPLGPRAQALWFPDSNPNKTVSSCDKATWIRSRRPSNPDFYCCNYNKVEAAIREGLPGKEEFDGGYLCLECLGFEYRDVDDNKKCA